MSEKCLYFYTAKEALTTDHAIVLPDVDDCSYSRYLAKINSIVGAKHIHSIFESNGQIKIYFKDKKYVNEILESGVFLNKDFSKVSPKDFVVLKVILSRVDPSIPDNYIEEVLKTYGHLESPIVRTKISKKNDFAHIECGIREVKLKVPGGLKFPRKFNLFYKGVFYEVDAKVIEDIPLRKNSRVRKIKKKNKYDKYKSTNFLKCDSSLNCENPEWCKNNPDNCGDSKSLNSIDLLLQIHQSLTCLPKRNDVLHDKENDTAVSFEKNVKLPIIQEQQLAAFSKNVISNSSFDAKAKIDENVLVRQCLNDENLQSRISIQSKQTFNNKTNLKHDSKRSKSLDSDKKRQKFEKTREDVALVCNSKSNRTKPAHIPLNINKDLSTKIYNTRGAIKKKFSKQSIVYDETACIQTRSSEKRQTEKSYIDVNEFCLPSTSSCSPNLTIISKLKKTLSEKLNVSDNSICSPSKSSSKYRSVNEKMSPKRSFTCDNNVYSSSDSPSLLNYRIIKRKIPLKTSCTYSDHMCSSLNSSSANHKTVKKKTSFGSNICKKGEYKPSNTSSLLKLKIQKGKVSEEFDNVHNNCSLSNTSTSLRSRTIKRKTSQQSAIHINEECLSSYSSSAKHRTIKVESSDKSSVCNHDVYQVSSSTSVTEPRVIKRKTSEKKSGANNVSPKSPSSTNLTAQKKKKLEEKADVCNNSVLLSSKSITSPDYITAQFADQDSNLNVSKQNAIDVHHSKNQSAISNDNSLSDSIQSDFRPNLALGTISNIIETLSPDVDIQHLIAEACNDVSSNISQLEDNIIVTKENVNICDKNDGSIATEINNEKLKDEFATCDLNQETPTLPNSAAAQTNVQIPALNADILNVDHSILLNIPNHVSEGNSEGKVSSVIKDTSQSISCNVNDLNFTKNENNDDLTKVSAEDAMHINSSKEKKETPKEISIPCGHISSSISSSLMLVADSDKNDSNFSVCNPEDLNSSKRHNQNIVPTDISQSHCEDNSNLHINPNIILIKTTSNISLSQSNPDDCTLESDLSCGEYVNKDENNKNATVNYDKIVNLCSDVTSSANQESLYYLPNISSNRFNSNKIDSHQYNKKQTVSRKFLQPKFRSKAILNPASFLIKNKSRTKSKNYAKYPVNKMDRRLQSKCSLSHQTKKQREFRNRKYLFSSTQDKNIYEYEFDSDEDYSDQVSYSKWKNQNCSSKEYKKLDANFTKKLTHSFNSYLLSKKRKNRIDNEVMDKNSEISSFNSKITSEHRKRLKEGSKNNVQVTGNSSTKRKRVNSSENFNSDNDYFEVVHVGDGKHDKLSIIVKKKSKLDAPNKNNNVNANSDIQSFESISKDSPSEFIPDPHNSRYMNIVEQQSIKKCQKKIASHDFIQNASPEIFGISNDNISGKRIPEYRVKSNALNYGEIISTPKTFQKDGFVSNHKFQENSLIPEGNTINKKGLIDKSQQLLQSNTSMPVNGHSSYKIVLQKISEDRSKNSSGRANNRKIVKTKYRLKSNQEETISKSDKNKSVDESKSCNNKNVVINNDVSPRNRNNLGTIEQNVFLRINRENAGESITIDKVTDSDPASVLQQNDNTDEGDFHSCVSGFLQQLASCSQQNKCSKKTRSSQISKFNQNSGLQNGLFLEKELDCDVEQNIDCTQEKNAHLTPEVTKSFVDKISHSGMLSSSLSDKDNNALNKVFTTDDSYYNFYHLRKCSVLLERIPIPEELLCNANASFLLESESNGLKPLKVSFTLTSNAKENEQSNSSNTTFYIKQEPCDYTFDGVNNTIEVEETTNPCFSSFSDPNNCHDFQSRSCDNVPYQDDILIQVNDNSVTNVISYNEIENADFSNVIYDIKEEPNSLLDYERKIVDNSSIISECSFKQSEDLNGNQKLLESVNISEKSIEIDRNSVHKNLSNSAPNHSTSQFPEISSVSFIQNDFNCSGISECSNSKNESPSNIESRRNNFSSESNDERQNDQENPHFVEFSKGDNDISEPNTDKMEPSNLFQVKPFISNGLQSSISTNTAGKLKKWNTKLTSIDKIAEFCALRKSASQIPALQLKISLLNEQDNPVINSENSTKQTYPGGLPSISTETIVDEYVKPDFNKSVEKKKENVIVECKSVCESIDLSVKNEQNDPTAIALEQTEDEVGKELTFTSCFREPHVSNDKKEKSMSSSNPPEILVDKVTSVQLNQSQCQRNNTSGVLNRTDTYVVKSVAVKPQYVMNKSIPKRVYPKLRRKYPFSEKNLIAFVNCMKYTKNVKQTTLQMLARNKTPGALKDLIVQLYEFFQVCHDSNKKLQISRLIMLLNEK